MRLFAALALALALKAQPTTGAVEGVVTNSVTGAPVRKALVTLREVDNYAGYQALTDTADPGQFQVGVSEITDDGPVMDFTLSGPRAGTVRVNGDARVALDTVRVRLEGDEPWNSGSAGVQPDGRFTIPKLAPAACQLRLELPPGVYLQSIRQGERILETPRFEIADNAAPLVVSLGTARSPARYRRRPGFPACL